MGRWDHSYGTIALPSLGRAILLRDLDESRYGRFGVGPETVSFDLGSPYGTVGQVSIARDTLTWAVQWEKSATELAVGSRVGALVLAGLSRLSWRDGSGGVIWYRSDEHEEAGMPAAARWVFGPLGAQQAQHAPRR